MNIINSYEGHHYIGMEYDIEKFSCYCINSQIVIENLSNLENTMREENVDVFHMCSF